MSGPFKGGTHCLGCAKDFPSVDADIAHRPCPGIAVSEHWAKGVSEWQKERTPPPDSPTPVKPTRTSWFKVKGPRRRGTR